MSRIRTPARVTDVKRSAVDLSWQKLYCLAQMSFFVHNSFKMLELVMESSTLQMTESNYVGLHFDGNILEDCWGQVTLVQSSIHLGTHLGCKHLKNRMRIGARSGAQFFKTIGKIPSRSEDLIAIRFVKALQACLTLTVNPSIL